MKAKKPGPDQWPDPGFLDASRAYGVSVKLMPTALASLMSTGVAKVFSAKPVADASTVYMPTPGVTVVAEVKSSGKVAL